MSVSLDVERLQKLAREKTVESRTELAAVVDSLFEDRGGALSEREKALMLNIIENLIHEVEVTVRKKLSEKLADDPDVPRELAKTLASDEMDVAYPILTKSQVLKDEDLVEIIHLRTEEYHLVIALRQGLGENVSDALVETNNANVVTQLLKNDSARISQATLAYLVEQSRRVDTFQEPLLHRSDLTEGLAKKMFMWVSSALRSHIVDRYEIDDVTVDRLLEQAAWEGYEATIAEHTEPASELLKRLRERGMVTPEILVQSLSDGEVLLFLAIFADLTRLDDVLIRRIVFEKGGEGMAIACRAIELSEFDFATIYRKSRRVAPDRAAATREEVGEILDLYRRIHPDDAKQVLVEWRDDKDYKGTIETLLGTP